MADGFYQLLEVFIEEADRALARIEAKALERIPQAEAPWPGWVNKQRLAEHLGVSARTVENWTSKRRIPHVRLGKILRFKLQEVDEHLKRGGFGRTF